MLQGARNSPAQFQTIMTFVLGDLVGDKCLVFFDDILVFGDTVTTYVNNMLAVLRRLHEVGFKASVKKTLLYATEVLFCGQLYDASGVRANPEFVQALSRMAVPITAGDLQSYLASCNWLRAGIPQYAKLVAPLQDLLTLALRQAESAKRKSAVKVKLSDVSDGWTTEHDEAFKAVNHQLSKSVSLAYPDPTKLVRVFTDASDTHWSGVIVQLDPADVNLDYKDQVCQPLAFVSGAFRDSQLKWPTVEKEGFAIKETCHRCAHILQRPSGFDILTDHRNLMFLFNSEAAVADGRRQAADRIERWMVLLRAFNYRILHIPGCDNITADMLTRWAADRTMDDTQALDYSVSVAAIASTQLLQDSLRFDSVDIPTELELRQAQAAISQADRTSLSLDTNADGLLVNKDDRIFVPDSRALRLRLFIGTHQGVGGHAAVDVSLAWLRARFWWPTMEADVRAAVAACSFCLKVKGGRVVPRPLLATKRATRVNEVIHFDYAYVRDTTEGTPSGYKYVLVLMDGFSKFVELVPAVTDDAQTVVNALLDWFKRFGVVNFWVSDRGTHFTAAVMAGLRTALGAHHHFTATYAAWSNGQVERVNRKLRETLSAMRMEAGLTED
jgi:hypothetical protein